MNPTLPQRPLRSVLAEAAADLRSCVPPDDLEQRIARRIDTRALKTVRRVSSVRWRVAAGMAVAAFAAAMVFALYPQHATAGQDHALTVEIDDTAETTWVEVDLLTKHHGDEHVVFHIEAPVGVFIQHTQRHDDLYRITDADCDAGTCRLVLAHPPGGVVGPPLRFGVSEPGSFSIRVTHHSSRARVTEAIELLAIN